MTEKIKFLIQDFGIGDCVISTVAIRNLRKTFPEHKIIVASIYSEIFKNNPNIDLLYQLGTLNDMYDKWVRKITNQEDFLCLKPYESRIQFFGKEPMSKMFCDLVKLPFDKDVMEVYLTKEEEEFGKQFIKAFSKPVIVIQAESARVSLRGGEKMITEKDWFNEKWDEVVQALNDEYDFVQVGGKDEYRVKGIRCSLLGKNSYRESAAILKNCHTFLTIDSAVSHLGPAVGKTGIVLFGRSKVETLGHKYNNNIEVKVCPIQPCLRPEPAVGDIAVKPDNTVGNWTCPDRICMKAITPEIVIDAVRKWKPGVIE